MNTGRGPVKEALLCFAVGLGLAAAAALAQRAMNVHRVEERFEAVAGQAVNGIAARMRNFEYGLRGMRGVALVSGQLPTLDQVRRYAASREIATEFSGARGFGLIWRVAPGAQADFEARMRAGGHAGFAVHQLAAQPDERYVIGYLEPQRGNEQAIGLDIASEPRRRKAAQAAQASGRASITEPITLVQSDGRPLRSFLVLLPIAPASMAAQSADAIDAMAGWSFTPVIIDEVLATIELPEHLAWMSLRDAGVGQAGVFYASAGPPPQEGLPTLDIPIQMYDRQWIASLRATPTLIEELHLTSPALVGAVGVLVAALAGWVALLLGQRRVRRRMLYRERAERAAIVDGSADGIVCVGLDGVIVGWNRAAQHLFGIDASAALGRSLHTVLPPPPWLDEEAVILASVNAGRYLEPFETQRRRPDGGLVDVSLSVTPIQDDQARLVSLAMTFRDIRAGKAAQRALEALNATLEQQVGERTAALDQTLHDLRSIVDALPSMIAYWDAGLRNKMANRAYAGWFGTTPERLRGSHLLDLQGAELGESKRFHIDAALRGQARTFECGLAPPGGRGQTQVLVHYLPDLRDGQVRGFYVLIHDVSELQAQRSALEAEKRDKAALLATIDAHAIVSSTDANGIITSVNERFCRISGYRAVELVGRTHAILDSGVHPPAFWESMWQVVRGGATWQGEICNRSREGALYWVDAIIAPFHDEHGNIERIIAFGSDITGRNRPQ